jgi:hypothetical protein
MKQIEKLLAKDVHEKEASNKLIENIETAAEKVCEITN